MTSMGTDTGYTYDDLDWLRDEIGVAHLELDPWGSLIVTPANDQHDTAMAKLHGQTRRQLALPDECIRANGFGWIVPDGSGYLNVPDLTILARDWTRIAEYHVDPPPLLVVEIGSPSTKRVDRTRKLADYRLGGAGLYLLVNVPTARSSAAATFVAHDFATGEVTSSVGAIDLVVGGQPVRFAL